jgi:cytochrome P450/NADPH-cytochrome P450 reductase
MTHQIPQPRGLPFLGNILSIDRGAPATSFALLHQQYGEIYRLDLPGTFDRNFVTLKCPFLRLEVPGRRLVVINSHKLLNEVCDEKRFPKAVAGSMKEATAVVHDGLFTCVSYVGFWCYPLNLPETEPTQ